MPDSSRSDRYDVFMSYDHRDAAIVDALAQHLTAEGFRVWLDSWELIPGAPATAAVEKAVSESIIFAVCVGERTSEWLDAELDLAYATYGAGATTRLLPILLPGSSAVPAKLADRSALDLRDGLSRDAVD